MTAVENHNDCAPSRGQPGAVVLAAGRSARMGVGKALLPLAGMTALERVVSSLREAGVGHVIVVTGHEPEALLPVLARLEVDHAHNPDYDLGMFSSVRAGVARLPTDLDSFFVLPVDCPLVTPKALRLLVQMRKETRKGILFPVCCRQRGHPPLISAQYVPALLDADPHSDLRSFLGSRPDDQLEIDVRDLTVLMDMDTPDQHRILDRLAAGQAAEPLSEAAALFLLSAAGTPSNVIEHSQAVAGAGDILARALHPHLPELDTDLVRAGCLLHDLARLERDHARLAEELLDELGFHRVGAVVGQHMVISPGLVNAPSLGEADLVYLADKLVAEDEVVGLEERQARALRKLGPDAAGRRWIEARIADARAIAAKVESVLSMPLDVLLSEEGPAHRYGSAALRVYLARHAESAGCDQKRFLGRADPGLGPAGERQAEALGKALLNMTGGACFDSAHSSDLRRSLRTAEIASRLCGTPVQAERWLREIDVGLWEGLSREEAARDYPDDYARREQDLVGEPFPEGESFADLRARVVPPFLRLVQEALAAGQRRILVVGHKGVNRVILAHVLGLPPEELFTVDQEYCGVAVLRATGDGQGPPHITVEDRTDRAWLP